MVLLDNESEEKFEILEDRYIQQMEPEGPVEEFMVDDLIADDWRIRRARGIEAAMMNKAVTRAMEAPKTGDQLEIDLEQVLFDVIKSKPFEAISRYQSRLSVSYHRTLKGLAHLRKNFSSSEEEQPIEPEQHLTENEFEEVMKRVLLKNSPPCPPSGTETESEPETQQEVPNPAPGPAKVWRKAA